MRIAISNGGQNWRGTDQDTWILANGLAARGHDILVLCRPGSVMHEKLLADPETARRITIAPVLRPFDFHPKAIIGARAAMRDHRSQIVVIHNDKDLRLTGVAAWLSGVPVLVRHVTDRPLKRRLRYRFMFGRIATHHLANSAATLATLRASAPWLDADVPVLHNGIDVQAAADAAPADLGLPEDAIAVGFVGAFELRKGIVSFGKAWQRIAREVPNAHAIIVGDGARERDFREAIGDAPRVHWLGFRRDIPNVMNALDIFVLPSYFEGFGLVLAEAMAAGVAPVAFDTSNIPELVQNGATGVLVEARNDEALADGVIRLARDSVERERIGQAAQAHAFRSFTADRMIAEHEQLIAEIVRSTHGTS